MCINNKIITNCFDSQLKHNYQLRALNWLKINAVAEYFFAPETVPELAEFLRAQHGLPIHVLGAGSNTLIATDYLKGVLIWLGNLTDISMVEHNIVEVQAGVKNLILANYMLKNNLTGGEFLAGIPGTIGGSIIMNAGSMGSEVKDICHNILAIDYYGNYHNINANDIVWQYRSTKLPVNDLIVLTIQVKGIPANYHDIQCNIANTKSYRKMHQPQKSYTLGSTFKNPDGYAAWQLIDGVGLRGYKIGGAWFSDIHCNFIQTDGKASFRDILNLIQLATELVNQKYNIMLCPEIRYLNNV